MLNLCMPQALSQALSHVAWEKCSHPFSASGDVQHRDRPASSSATIAAWSPGGSEGTREAPTSSLRKVDGKLLARPALHTESSAVLSAALPARLHAGDTADLGCSSAADAAALQYQLRIAQADNAVLRADVLDEALEAAASAA
jgi:hypothetical protein